MATIKQIRANRLNAQKCAGPSSAEGKARSSQNALKSGIQAESEVLPWEDPAERATVAAEWTQHHHPCTPEERTLVDSLAHAEFIFRRLRRAEVKIVISKIPDSADLDDDAVIGKAYADASGELGRLQRRMDATNRAFHRDLDQLRLLVAERPPVELPPPLILVPPQPDPPPAETAAPEPPPSTPPDPPAPAAPAHSRAGEPDPRPPDPILSTPQPTESTTQTQQMDSFGKKPEIAPEPAPGPRPPAPEKPRGFNPLNPHHPPIEMCAWCTDHGQIQTNCHFWPRGWPRP